MSKCREVLSFNNWLREDSPSGTSMRSWPLPESQELLLVLQTIQTYVSHMNTGRVKIVIRPTTTGLYIDVLKEMSS